MSSHAQLRAQAWSDAGSRFAPALEPQLQHHQYPHHRPIVSRVIGEMLVEQAVKKIAAHDVPAAKCRQGVAGEGAQPVGLLEPGADRQSESMLLLGDDLRWKKVLQRFLEEIAQPGSTQLLIRR